MMTSWHTARVWDWLSASLMIVGFTIMLGLACYLVYALVAGDGGRAPEDDRDLLTPGEAAEDTRFEGWITPLAS